MDWKTIAGILLLPLIGMAVWYIFAPHISPEEPIAPATFVQDGNLVQNNPGLEPGVWFLVYEKPGAPGLTQRLEFNGDSRCGSETMLRICEISFAQGERVRIEGTQSDGTVIVSKLLYLTQGIGL